jgi:hypothetical protein
LGFALLTRPERERLGVSQPECWLQRCGCGAHFVASFRQKTCLACSRAAALDRFRAYTAERSADRAEPREGFVCERCGAAIPSERSTRKFCTDACRQAACRGRA